MRCFAWDDMLIILFTTIIVSAVITLYVRIHNKIEILFIVNDDDEAIDTIIDILKTNYGNNIYRELIEYERFIKIKNTNHIIINSNNINLQELVRKFNPQKIVLVLSDNENSHFIKELKVVDYIDNFNIKTPLSWYISSQFSLYHTNIQSIDTESLNNINNIINLNIPYSVCIYN